MKYVICFLSLVLPGMAIDQCLTKAGLPGFCTEILECPTLHQLSYLLPAPSLIKEYGGCGKRNANIRLCCPNEINKNNDDNTELNTPSPTSESAITPRRPGTTENILVTTPTSPGVTERNPIITPKPPGITAKVSVTTPSTPNAPLNCKGEFKAIAGKCLVIGQKYGKWSDGEAACTSKSGKLAIFYDNVEGIAEYIRKNQLGGPSAWYWVGASDKATPGTFRWSTGETVNGPWRDHEPWSNQPGRMCIFVSDEGLGRTPCLDATWYICEAD